MTTYVNWMQASMTITPVMWCTRKTRNALNALNTGWEVIAQAQPTTIAPQAKNAVETLVQLLKIPPRCSLSATYAMTRLKQYAAATTAAENTYAQSVNGAATQTATA